MVLPWQGFEATAVRLADAQLGATLDREFVRVWAGHDPRNSVTEQNVAERRPRRVQHNGLPSLFFDGTNDALIAADTMTGVPAGASFTVFTVAAFQQVAENFNGGLFELGINPASVNQGLMLFHEGNDLVARMTGTSNLRARWPSDGKTHIFEVTHTSTERAIFVDGVELRRAALARATPAGIDSLIEGMLPQSIYPFRGWMKSNLIFASLLSDSNRATIRERLRVRWLPNAPQVQNWDPPEGTTISPEQTIRFDLVGDNLLAMALVGVRYPSGAFEVVWDGFKFADAFRARSTRNVIPKGTRFNIRRFGLWLGDPTIEVRAVDSQGRTLDTDSSGRLSAALASSDTPVPAAPDAVSEPHPLLQEPAP